MSKHTVSNINVVGDNVTFTVRIRGAVKDQAARTNWTISDMNLLLSDNSVSLKALVEGYVASGHYWIKIQGWLRKCTQHFVESLVGTSMSWLAFRTTVAAALPKGQDKTELLGEIHSRDNEIAKLRAVLKASGLTDEQIDAAINE